MANVNQSSINSMLKQMKSINTKNTVTQVLEIESLPKEEKHKLFKDLLKKGGITTTWKWEDAERVLCNEPIWKSIKTFQEKRGLFNEYIRDCKLKEREDLKLKRERLKLKFRQMLEEDTGLNSNSKFSEALTKYCYDERWRAIDERDREEIFQDYIDLLFKREEDEWLRGRETKRQLFEKELIERGLGTSTRWKDLPTIFANDPLFNSMEKIDQLDTFTNYILKLEKEEKRKKKEDEKYQGYQNREKFRDLLQAYVDKGMIDMKSKWSKFVPLIKDKEDYLHLLIQSASTTSSSPRDLFFDLVESLKNDYKKNKNILKKILKENTIKFSSNVSYEDYNEILKKYPDYALITMDMKKVLYDHLIKKLKEKENEHMKRELKIANKIRSYIQRGKLDAKEEDEFEAVLPKIREHKKFAPISDENLRFAYKMVKDDWKGENNPEAKKEEKEELSDE